MDSERYNKIMKELEGLDEEERKLVMDNMPSFDRGIVEASLEKEQKIWQDLIEVFRKHNIMPQYSSRIKSDNQQSEDGIRPNLVCAGVEVGITFVANPVDIEGRDGSMPNEVHDKIAELRKKRAELQNELQMG